jgi:hypothetical protein
VGVPPLPSGPAKTGQSSAPDIGAALERWAAEAQVRLLKANAAGDVAAFQTLAEEAEQGVDHAPNPHTRAILLATAAMARFALFHLGKDRKDNGIASFKEFKEGFETAPDRQEAATGFGQAVLALSKQGFVTRKLLGLMGVSVGKSDAQAVSDALAGFPEDALSQLLRQRLAHWCKDGGAEKEAAAKVAALKAKGGASAAQVAKMDQWLAGLEKQASQHAK